MRIVTLGSCAELNPKSTDRIGEDERVSFVPMSAVSELDGSLVPEDRTYREVGKGYTAFANGDVLVAKITPCFENGKIAHARLPTSRGFGSTEFHVVRPDSEALDTRYIFHFLRQGRIRCEGECRMTGSAGQRRVPAQYLDSLEIPLPPLPEQRRIAEILDHADALRARRRAALAQLDELTRAIFLEMFGDPVKNPKGWMLTDVGDTADVQGGLQVTRSRRNNPKEVPYLRVANVFRGYLDLGEIKTLRVTDAEFTRTLLQADDLLIVEGHGNPEEIGRAALWDGSIEGCVHQNHLIRVRFDRRRIHPVFGCAYLNSPGGRRHLLRAGKTTSGLNTISTSEVRSTPIAVPNPALQRDFARRAAAVERLKVAQRASLAELDALFASLQHRAFRGEL